MLPNQLLDGNVFSKRSLVPTLKILSNGEQVVTEKVQLRRQITIPVKMLVTLPQPRLCWIQPCLAEGNGSVSGAKARRAGLATPGALSSSGSPVSFHAPGTRSFFIALFDSFPAYWMRSMWVLPWEWLPRRRAGMAAKWGHCPSFIRGGWRASWKSNTWIKSKQ